MIIDETPIDCYKIRCFISGSGEQLLEDEREYIQKYPYMRYGTRRAELKDDGIVMFRFRTSELCAQACIHKPNPHPVGEDTTTERGKDHTVFQTNHTMRA